SGALVFALAGYKKILRGQNQDLESDIQELANSLPPPQLGNLLTLDYQVKNLKRLLPQHVYFSKLLDVLERNTHPQVRLNAFSTDKGAREVVISGFAPTSEVVSQQAAAYAAVNGFHSFAITEVKLVVGGYAFAFSFKVAPPLILP
ncbi:MAG: hypothetical protein HYS57_02335, partial [Parcubacteria group bacterium]|nr:hypothetical protein [Parcubacteria group bacterium]